MPVAFRKLSDLLVLSQSGNHCQLRDPKLQLHLHPLPRHRHHGSVKMNFYGTVIESQTISPADKYVQTMPNPPAVSSVTSTDYSATVSYSRIDEAYSYNIYYKKTADSAWSGPLSRPTT